MTSLSLLVRADLARGKTVQLLFDADVQNREPYMVGSYFKTKLYKLVKYAEGKDAALGFEDEACRPGPGGDGSWTAVLARCRGVSEVPTEWEGSPAEYAARFADIGTWQWLEIIRACRKATEEKSNATDTKH